jgi:hypothetical protein
MEVVEDTDIYCNFILHQAQIVKMFEMEVVEDTDIYCNFILHQAHIVKMFEMEVVEDTDICYCHTHPLFQWVPGTLSQGVKQQGHEAEVSRIVQLYTSNYVICLQAIKLN